MCWSSKVLTSLGNFISAAYCSVIIIVCQFPIRVVSELLVKGIITCLNDGVNYKYEDDVVEWF